MKLKRYIGILVFLVTLIGVVSQQHTTLPNQELVLEFTNSEITPFETQETVALLKKQLRDLGVKNIHVKEGLNGQLRLLYHSDHGVEFIRSAIIEESPLTVTFRLSDEEHSDSNVPVQEGAVSCNLNIYEIHDNKDASSDLGGHSLITLNYKGERLLFPELFSFCSFLDKCKMETFNFNFRLYKQLFLEIEEPLHVIPEVRAGPVA
ncbi:hypothetical protein [Aestuariivivens sediminicola]|uniref:hypothetical protein n=1 Tax=Aestuariivivens sediminicola TaxID=2913560 RepID=UPI001F566CF2|nr:hypothetical protein [Aestuariivivens sediminicola]